MSAPPRHLALLLGLLVATLAAWNAQAVVGFDFVAMDDDINIYFNPHLGPPGPQTLEWMFTDTAYMRRYVPLGWLGFSTIYTFSGLSPLGYHAANLAFHVVNTLLLFNLLLRLLRRWGGGAGPLRTAVGAALGTALWAWHPFRAEIVGWASGLLYGPAGTLALLAVLSYLRALETRGPLARRWLCGAVLAYLGSLLVYPVGLGLIGIFLLLDLADRYHAAPPGAPPAHPHPALRHVLAEKAFLALPGLLVLALTVNASVSARAFWVKPPSLDEFGWLPRAAQAAYAAAAYQWRRWWPVDLTPAPTRLLDFQPTEPIFWLSALGLLAITATLCARRAWRRGPLLLWLGFFTLLIPLLGFMERPYFPCDRYDFLPSMVLSAAVALALVRLPSRPLKFAAITTLAGLLLLAWLQHTQLLVWRDTDSLKQRMVASSNHRAFLVTTYGSWARYHAQRGAFARASALLAECERVCGSGPWLAPLRAEVAATPSAAALHTRLAIDFSRAGRLDEAREQLRAALRLDPGLASAGFNYATLHALAGEPRDALHWYFRTVARAPHDVPSSARRRLLALIAEAFAQTREPTLAIRTLELALREPGTPAELDPLRHQLARHRPLAPP